MGSFVLKRFSCFCLVIILLGLVSTPLFAQANRSKIDRLEFPDIPITEVLIALANIKNVSIITDETVHGNTTFSFIDIGIDDAFNLFLQSHDLYLTVRNGIYYVSKIRIEYDKEAGRVTLDANNVGLRILIDAISKAVNKTIHYDPLPTLDPPVHANDMKVDDLLKMLLVRAPDYTLELNPNYYYIKHTPPTPGPNDNVLKPGQEQSVFEKKGEFYSINKTKQSFFKLLSDLFGLEGKEYIMLTKREAILDTVRFKDKRFEELLSLVMEQANADYAVKNGIYYIFEIDQNDVLKDLMQIVHIPLQYLSPSDVQRVMPPELGNSKYYRIDTNTNSIILNGSEKEIGPIKDFIRTIDKPLGGAVYYRYDLNFIKAANVKSMLPNKYRQMEIITIPETNSMIMLLTPTSKMYMDEFLNVLDVDVNAVAIILQYIKAEDLMKNLPPSVNREDLLLTADPSVIFFKGTEDRLRVFREQLDSFDRPVPQIRYEVLVISYSEDEGLNWRQNEDDVVSLDFTAKESDEDGNYAPGFLIGTLSNILSLNFDIPYVLGMTAALNLNLALSNSKAKVLTDTTLHGISGKRVSFQDTEVYRYRAKSVDPNAGEGGATNTAGPIQEITTGFTLKIEGWISGNNMISMNVDITSKKQGSAASDSSGSLGSTFDKVISTDVRVASGEPFKIGGLIKQDKIVSINKIPFLGDIPVVGVLFQKKKEEIRKSEIVIYILPHIVKPADEIADISTRLEKMYNKYVSD